MFLAVIILGFLGYPGLQDVGLFLPLRHVTLDGSFGVISSNKKLYDVLSFSVKMQITIVVQLKLSASF